LNPLKKMLVPALSSSALQPARPGWGVLAPIGGTPVRLLPWPQHVPQGAARRLAQGTFRLAPVVSLSSVAAPAAANPSPEAVDDARARRDAELAALLTAAAQGNASAFERVYDMTVGYAQALARRMLAPSDAEDVIADAYFQAWRESRSFDVARGSAVTWLLTIVRSRALDLLRRHKASPEVAGTDDDAALHPCTDAPTPADWLAGVEAGSRLRGALDALSAQERWVLCLAYYRELSHREVCEHTGLPLGTVKSLILRAQGKLRALLADDRS